MTNSRRYAGVAAMIALLMLCALGAGARRHLALHRGSGIPDWVAVVVLLVAVVAAGAMLVLLLGSRRWRAPAGQRPLLYTAAAALVLLLVIGLVLILSDHSGRPPIRRTPNRPVGPDSSAAPTSAATAHHGGGSAGGVLLVLVVLLVVAVIGVLVARRRPTGPPPPEPQVEPATESMADLEHALGRAATALLDVDDPRAAIIAAYEQMQHTAQERGLVPGVTDTPAEFLARAARTGAVDPAAAARLTELFERARFSHRPITSDDRSAARAALAELRAGWARR